MLQTGGLLALALATVTMTSAAAASPLKLCGNFDISPGNLTGVYEGQWQEATSAADHVLVVLDVKSDGAASVLYAVGAWPQYGIKARCRPFEGRFTDDNTLSINFGNNETATYDFFNDFINAKYQSAGGTTRGRLTRSR